jgi:hypothetical protein
MRIGPCRYLLLAVIVASALKPAAAQSKAESKSAADKPEIETVEPFGRPEGAINDRSARIYLWHDEGGWHLRTTARTTHTFSGIVRVKDAKIMSCVPVGLKHDRKQTDPDIWQVNDARDELQFKFHTGRLSDGLDLVVKGDDGQIEFDLQIDSKNNPKEIFIGQVRKHPSKSPFTYPANPPNPKVADDKKRADR